MDLDDSQLDNVVITITDVREGSVIIDYSLESNVPDLVSSAMSNIDDMLGETITIGDDFELDLDSNEMVIETANADIENTPEPGAAAGMNTAQESGMGTSVEIALGATLAVVFIFLVLVLWFVK